MTSVFIRDRGEWGDAASKPSNTCRHWSLEGARDNLLLAVSERVPPCQCFDSDFWPW